MTQEKRFDEVVALLYQAAMDADIWRAALLGFAEFSGAQIFHAFAWDHRLNRPLLGIVSHDFLLEPLRQYEEYFHSVDPVLKAVLNGRSGQMVASQQLFDERFVDSNEYFQDFLIRNKFCWAAAGMIEVGGGIGATLALVRSHDNDRFADAELTLACRLWDHFGRAVVLFARAEELRQRASVGIQGLEDIEIGVLAVNATRQVVFANHQAEALIRAATIIRTCGGQLAGASSENDKKLIAAISAASRSSTGSSVQLESGVEGESSLFVTLIPLSSGSPAWALLNQPAVILLIRQPGHQRILSVSQLMQLFQLTPAEARLARALAHGQSVEGYATEAGLATTTVRTQLRAVLAKTRTTRQTELVRLLVSVAPRR